MFGWFKKEEAPPLEFTDNAVAFEYACRHLPNRILLEAVLPALVEEEGKRGPDGERCFLLRIAGPDSGRELWGCTAPGATDWPAIGDLVGFRIVSFAEDIGPDPLPIGYISSVLEPVLVAGKGWRISRNLTPKDLKPTVRF